MKGILRTTMWREVFERTWRHPYVPGYYPDKDSPVVLCADPAHGAEWLEAVYSDTTLITKVMPIPLSRELRPATGTIYTSSSTLPSLVLQMLEDLDVADRHRVLEIGTGTGYNAALLCTRLGSAQVTSVDIDPELIDLARERLAANGTAVGRFVPHWAGFMTMRHEVAQAETVRPWVCEPSSESVTSIDPAPSLCTTCSASSFSGICPTSPAVARSTTTASPWSS